MQNKLKYHLRKILATFSQIAKCNGNLCSPARGQHGQIRVSIWLPVREARRHESL